MKKITIFDWILIGTIVLISFVLIIPAKNSITKDSRETILTIKISTNTDVIYSEAIGEKEAFFDSVNKSVAIKNVSLAEESGTKHLLIEIESAGRIENNRYIFNGKRVLVGQKAELHGKFFAQGVITNVRYAD